MSPSVEHLKPILSALPVPDRAELAHYLLHTLEAPEEEAAAEWQALAEERMAKVRDGSVIGVPEDDVWKVDGLWSKRRP
jgi:hypothetical protein